MLAPVRRIAVPTMWVVLLSACPQAAPEHPPGTFRFAAMGDAPYNRFQETRFRRVLRRLDEIELAVVISVGDVLWYPCSDALYRARLAQFRAVRHPLVYTPGDNEWTDCHERITGSYQPLERLARLREIFYADPWTSLGARPIALAVQAADSTWSEFVENVRWTHAGFVFGTVHLVGSWNARARFPGRTARDDEEAARRTAADTAWLRDMFAYADSAGALGVVIATHADLVFDKPLDHPSRQAFEPFLETLEQVVERFAGPVLLVHGDSHEFTVDHPLVRRTTGRVLANMTRLQVLGSPDVGWVEVTVDTAAAQPFAFTPRTIPRWMFW